MSQYWLILTLPLKKEQSFLNPQNHLNRLGGKEMRAFQIILVIYPRISTPFFNNLSHESDYLDKNPKNTYQFDS